MNVFVFKKWLVLALFPMFPLLLFSLLTFFFGFLVGFLSSVVLVFVLAFIGKFLLQNEFSLMLEGKGLLVYNWDSTGVITPFLVNVDSPYIKGKLLGHDVEDVFDRDCVLQHGSPVGSSSVGEAIMEKDGGMRLTLSREDFSSARFALYGRPVLIWNDQLKSFLTKDFFASKETDVFAKHNILYLNRKVEDLSSHTRDFARSVVELLKPMKSFMSGGWLWIVVVVVVGLLALFMFPSLLKVFASGGDGGAVAGAASAAKSAFVPLGGG